MKRLILAILLVSGCARVPPADAEFREHLATAAVLLRADIDAWQADVLGDTLLKAGVDAIRFSGDMALEVAWLDAHPPSASCYAAVWKSWRMAADGMRLGFRMASSGSYFTANIAVLAATNSLDGVTGPSTC